MELQKAQIIARNLMDHHGLTTWAFYFDNAKLRFGVCRTFKQEIALSKYLTQLNNEEEVIDTILHEIAHGLTPGHKHNNTWKHVAKEIGCNASRCYGNEIILLPPKYIGTCADCGHIFKCQRLSLQAKLSSRHIACYRTGKRGIIKW